MFLNAWGNMCFEAGPTAAQCENPLKGFAHTEARGPEAALKGKWNFKQYTL